MRHFKQIICIVLDGVGVGEAPDAERYGDVGSNSLANTARCVGSLRLPVLERLGLGNITEISGVSGIDDPAACVGKMKPAAEGKDSTTGHWELMGCILETPFPTYPNGFPDDVIGSFEQAIGRGVIGNRTASGTTIIQELGEEHLLTGRPIVYTSQDSVFQVAAHQDVIPVDELYAMCEVARSMLTSPHGVARVIARPFTGSVGGFYRTPDRKDFSRAPVHTTVLDMLTDADATVLTIGKISDLFCDRGITQSVVTKDNRQGMLETLRAAKDPRADFVFVNLVDFDTMWGHRNDARAYALGLEEFDSYLGDLLENLGQDTLLLITSDHGNDPTTPSTDHSREYVPLIALSGKSTQAGSLGIRDTFADVAATIAENFELPYEFRGISFLNQLV